MELETEKEIWVEHKGNRYRVTEVIIDMPECAAPHRKDVKEVSFCHDNEDEEDI